jgi:hypothetical protein
MNDSGPAIAGLCQFFWAYYAGISGLVNSIGLFAKLQRAARLTLNSGVVVMTTNVTGCRK